MGFLPSGVRDLKFKHRFKYCICNKIMRHENLEHTLAFIGVHWRPLAFIGVHWSIHWPPLAYPLDHSLAFIGVHWRMQRVSDAGKPLWMPKLCVQTDEKEFRKNLINSNLGE